MRILFFFLYGVLFATTATAQFGITAFYQSSPDKFESYALTDGSILQEGYEVAADYWFRLPSKRIEFLPTVSYGRYQNSAFDNLGSSVLEEPQYLDFNATEIGFQFKTNFYIFDFGTDCDCPTWGKQGPALHKGFFVQLAPGVSHFSTQFDDRGDDFDTKATKTFFNVGIGAGIDFGISNLLTITPLVSYRYNVNQADLNDLFTICSSCSTGDDEGRISALQVGIRVGIRLDERRY